MKPLKLPKSVYVGRLFRLRLEDDLESILQQRLINQVNTPRITLIDGTKWSHFWLTIDKSITKNDLPADDGFFRYPFLFRGSDDRYILASTDAKIVDYLLESTSIAGFAESPRIQVDKAARDLVQPPINAKNLPTGRRYTIGAVYGVVEGYARALRNVSFFGDDIAEAALFRNSLEQIAVTRLTIRDPSTDRELLSINTTGGLDFHFSQPKLLNNIDSLTAYLRANNYIEWRIGKKWQPI